MLHFTQDDLTLLPGGTKHLQVVSVVSLQIGLDRRWQDQILPDNEGTRSEQFSNSARELGRPKRLRDTVEWRSAVGFFVEGDDHGGRLVGCIEGTVDLVTQPEQRVYGKAVPTVQCRDGRKSGDQKRNDQGRY